MSEANSVISTALSESFLEGFQRGELACEAVRHFLLFLVGADIVCDNLLFLVR